MSSGNLWEFFPKRDNRVSGVKGLNEESESLCSLQAEFQTL